ncbi:hypothetical protein C8R48DRAFT_735847 [Suillus tomentosus]|nr:hypothetical protein C8R48DRAFT_735847 [Suillus tomentosus]
MLRSTVLAFAALVSLTSATPLIYDGRAPFNYTIEDLDNSVDPYLSVVKGAMNASHVITKITKSRDGHILPCRSHHNCHMYLAQVSM